MEYSNFEIIFFCCLFNSSIIYGFINIKIEYQFGYKGFINNCFNCITSCRNDNKFSRDLSAKESGLNF